MSLTILYAGPGYVCFQVDSGPECTAFVGDLHGAMAEFDYHDRARVDGQLLDEADVDLLLAAVTQRVTP